MSKNNMPPPNQPHAAAAGKYDRHAQAHTPDQRELEARVLLKSAKNLQLLRDDWDNSMTPETLDDLLRYNRHIWLMFVDNAAQDSDPERPQELRANIANLGAFIFNHSMELLANPAKEKLDVLIEINREIAAGLMSRPKAQQDTGSDAANNPAG